MDVLTECQAPTGGSNDEKVTRQRIPGAAVVGNREEVAPHPKMGRVDVQRNFMSRWRKAGRVFHAA